MVMEFGLKANLLQNIIKELNKLDASGAGTQKVFTGSIIDAGGKALEQIPEAQDEDAEAIRRSQMSMKGAMSASKNEGARKSGNSASPAKNGVRASTDKKQNELRDSKNENIMLRASGGSQKDLSQSPVRAS